MATALDIITRSLRDLGVLGIGEVPDADQAANGLVSLNELLGIWDNEGLLQYTYPSQTVTMTGTLTYQLTTRYQNIHKAYYTLNGIDYPVDVLTGDEYVGISNKSLTGSIVSSVFYNRGYPYGSILPYPLVSSGTLTVFGDAPFTEYTSLATSVSLPPGYIAALRANLADYMQSEYGKARQKIAIDAQRLKANLKRNNHKPRVMSTDMPIDAMNRNSYLIERGY